MPDVQMFGKRFWGFNPAVWPIVGAKGVKRKAAKNSSDARAGCC